MAHKTALRFGWIGSLALAILSALLAAAVLFYGVPAPDLMTILCLAGTVVTSVILTFSRDAFVEFVSMLRFQLQSLLVPRELTLQRVLPLLI